MGLQHLRLEPQGVDHIPPRVLVRAGDGPGTGSGNLFQGSPGLLWGQLHRLHHLTHHAVRKNHHRVAQTVRDVEGFIDQIHALLDARRGKDRDFHVAVVAAPGHLKVVRLAGLDAPHPGAAPGDVQGHNGYLAGGDEAQALLHQRQAGGAGGDEGPAAAGRRAVGHVHRGQLALRLDKGPARPGQLMAHVLRNFVLGGDGVAEIAVAAGADGSLGKSLVPLHQNSAHAVSPSSSS